MTVEFKSDQGPLSDVDLLETVVCLANRQGGTLLVGVEDDGRVTGLHPKRHSHPRGVGGFDRQPDGAPVTVEAIFVDLSEEGGVWVVEVPLNLLEKQKSIALQVHR